MWWVCPPEGGGAREEEEEEEEEQVGMAMKNPSTSFLVNTVRLFMYTHSLLLPPAVGGGRPQLSCGTGR